eukprot:582731-Pelagomonas_calceolata.AAC.1
MTASKPSSLKQTQNDSFYKREPALSFYMPLSIYREASRTAMVISYHAMTIIQLHRGGNN